MADWGFALVWAIDGVGRELMLFAAVGFLVGGIDDLAIDLLFMARRLRAMRRGPVLLRDLPAPSMPGRFAVFVPAWDESAVIHAMLTTALARFDHADYRIYVGCYPNDRATIDAVARIARIDARVVPVIGPRDGPTTKADCLNSLWRALHRDDLADGRQTRAIVLHDAEDVVHPLELRLYDALLDAHDIVQIPVLPLIDPRGRVVSATYADEFAEAHGKLLPIRVALGAGMPLAGVGCALSVAALRAIEARYGQPFDAESLTEDYELGLRIAGLGYRACFARVRPTRDAPPIAVRAYFPATITTAVRQKARWMTGIALSGWDRTGWSRAHHLGDHWMRARDRRAPIAAVVLIAAYAAGLCWVLGVGAHALTGAAASRIDPALALVLTINAALLGWRLAIRYAFTTRGYGWREGIAALARVLVSNFIAILAVRHAVSRYIATMGGAPVRWDKTAHAFPADLEACDP